MAVKTLGHLLDRFKSSLSNPICHICQKAVSSSTQDVICLVCERQLRLRQPVPAHMFPFGSVYAACEFPYPVKRLIYGLKFYNQENHRYPLTDILHQYWTKHLNELNQSSWLVVPIPAHGDRTRSTVSTFAQPFARQMKYDYQESLSWTRTVIPQHQITSKRKRRENMARALAVPAANVPKIQTYPNILVVDDILTTGTTLIEALAAIHRIHPNANLVGLTVAHVPLAVTRV